MATETYQDYLNRKKRKHQTVVTVYILILVFTFLLLFVPLDTVGITVNNNNIWETILKLASSSIISFIIRIPLFATDPLATGKSTESDFFRKRYPSHSIAENYDVDRGKAMDLWFLFFNKWANPASQLHSQWTTVLDRTYKCRYIYLSLIHISEPTRPY